jgi:hypothetical protein
MKKLLASAAIAAAMSLGGASFAHATTYILNVDGCSTGCGATNYGTVTTTGDGTGSLTIDVELAANVFFNQAGGANEFFSLTGDNPIDITSLSTGFTALGTQNAGVHSGGGTFGDFDYVIDWVGPPTNNGNLPGPPGGVQSLIITLTGTSPLSLTSGVVQHGRNPPTDSGIFFVADVFGPNGLTGNVGATLSTGGVPEPATWAMMLVGFFGMGGLLRRRRQAMATA